MASLAASRPGTQCYEHAPPLNESRGSPNVDESRFFDRETGMQEAHAAAMKKRICWVKGEKRWRILALRDGSSGTLERQVNVWQHYIVKVCAESLSGVICGSRQRSSFN
jgi:hypothetical protein